MTKKKTFISSFFVFFVLTLASFLSIPSITVQNSYADSNYRIGTVVPKSEANQYHKNMDQTYGQPKINLDKTSEQPKILSYSQKIPNQYIVVLKDDLKNPHKLIKEMSKDIESTGLDNIKVLQKFKNTIDGFVVKVKTENDLFKLKQDPNVKYIEQDQKIYSFAQTLPNGINRIDGDLSFAKSGDGTGSVNVDIGILDTGIYKHKDLNVYVNKDFVYGFFPTDRNGHGTHVAGIAAAKDNSDGVVGVAPGARLWNLKVLGNDGSGSISTLISGIDYVTSHASQIDVVNLSLGCECTSNALNDAITRAVNAGVTFVVAAGNSGKDAKTFSPANHPKVIAVSAIADTDGKCGGLGSSTKYGQDDSLASFSNYGSAVDIAAPGVGIYSTYKSSYATLSGTSMAAPHVTGAAALYLSKHPGASPSEVANALMNLGAGPGTICDGKGDGYFTGDRDAYPESMLYVRNIN